MFGTSEKFVQRITRQKRAQKERTVRHAWPKCCFDLRVGRQLTIIFEIDSLMNWIFKLKNVFKCPSRYPKTRNNFKLTV